MYAPGTTRTPRHIPLRLACVLAAAMWVLPTLAAAQEASLRAPDRARRFSVAFDVAHIVGGPTARLVEDLARGGFDETIEGGCSYSLGFELCIPTQRFPVKSPPGVVAALTARWAINRRWALGGGIGLANLGEASGYRGGSYLRLGYVAREVWVAGYWQPWPWMHMGGGPAWYALRESYSQTTVSRLGAITEVTVEVPVARELYLRVGARAYFVPSVEVQSLHHLTMSLRPAWSHVTLAAGVGVRL